jgi:hypothetical protein
MTIENAITKARKALKSAGAHRYFTCCVPYSIDCLLPPELELSENWYVDAQASNQNRSYRNRGGVNVYAPLAELFEAGLDIRPWEFDLNMNKVQEIFQVTRLIRRELDDGAYGVLLNEGYRDQNGDISSGHLRSIGINRRRDIHYDTAHFGKVKDADIARLVASAREHIDPSQASIFILRRI